MTEITLEMLKNMDPGMFASGTKVFDGTQRTWVATRGFIHDWAIYELPSIEGIRFMGGGDFLSHIKDWGNKVHNMSIVKDLVSSNEEALKMYRH